MATPLHMYMLADYMHTPINYGGVEPPINALGHVKGLKACPCGSARVFNKWLVSYDLAKNHFDKWSLGTSALCAHTHMPHTCPTPLCHTPLLPTPLRACCGVALWAEFTLDSNVNRSTEAANSANSLIQDVLTMVSMH